MWLSGSADYQGQSLTRDVNGPVDPRFRLSVNVYGAPALSAEQFASYRQDLIVGVSLQVSAPLGEYDSSRVVNIGTNRWSFKPELGMSKAWGALTLELIPGITFFTTNHDFFGGKTLEQDPIYSLQGHLIYEFSPAFWAALNTTYYTGGRTTVNGENERDALAGRMPRQDEPAFHLRSILARKDDAHRRIQADLARERRVHRGKPPLAARGWLAAAAAHRSRVHVRWIRRIRCRVRDNPIVVRE